MCTLWSLELAKKSCNSINNSRAQVSRLCYFLWLWCDVGEYLDYENCKCTKQLVDKLVDECAKTVEKVKITKITLAENENSYKCNSYPVYIALFSIFFTINIGIVIYFVYSHWYLKKDVLHTALPIQTTIY